MKTVKSFLLLIVFAFLLLFSVSRFGLFIHEILGHWLLAQLAGQSCSVGGFSFFAGAWVNTDFREYEPIPRVLVNNGGLIAEFLFALLFLILAMLRSASGGRFLLMVLTAGLTLSASGYLALSNYYQLGDGRLLSNFPFFGGFFSNVVFFLCCLLFSYFAGTSSFTSFRGFFPGWPRVLRLFAVSLAAGLGAVLYFAGFLLEQQLMRDPVFDSIMTPESTYIARREANQTIRKLEDQGKRLSDEERRQILNEKLSEHRPFPFEVILIPSMLLMILVGAWDSRILNAKLRPDTSILNAPFKMSVAAAILVVLLKLLT